MLVVVARFVIIFFAVVYILAVTIVAKEKEFNYPKVDWRLSLAGGVAGGMSNAIIYPIDTVKTMMQSDSGIKSVHDILRKLGSNGKFHKKIYSGFFPAVLGAIPSSAIYFGSYETMKQFFFANFKDCINRQSIHMLSASCGNILSSIVFVPKETIKQNLQAIRTGVISNNRISPVSSTIDIVKDIMKERGIKGFYPSYRATLLRNIPSAVIRFTLYEELRSLIKVYFPENYCTAGYMAAGALSSAISSAATTPFDVVKTRISTGIIPPGSPVFGSIIQIAKTEGLAGLYAGVLPRILWSALFGGIGFTCFEQSKKLFHVD